MRQTEALFSTVMPIKCCHQESGPEGFGNVWYHTFAIVSLHPLNNMQHVQNADDTSRYWSLLKYFINELALFLKTLLKNTLMPKTALSERHIRPVLKILRRKLHTAYMQKTNLEY